MGLLLVHAGEKRVVRYDSETLQGVVGKSHGRNKSNSSGARRYDA